MLYNIILNAKIHFFLIVFVYDGVKMIEFKFQTCA